MAVLNLEEIVALKKAVKEQFGEELHAHDACGGQSFDVAEMAPELREFLTGYFDARGLKVAFSQVDGQFVVR